MNDTPHVRRITRLVNDRSSHIFIILDTVSNAAGTLLRLYSDLSTGHCSRTGCHVGRLRHLCLHRVSRLLSAKECHRLYEHCLHSAVDRLGNCGFNLFAACRRHAVISCNRLLDARVLCCCVRRYNVRIAVLPTLSFVHASGSNRPSVTCVHDTMIPGIRNDSDGIFLARNFVYEGICNRISGLRHNKSSCATDLVNTILDITRVRV